MTRGLVIAGTHSGVGKTTISLGLMAALSRRGLKVQAFKVGPDFIDPGHHTRLTGRPSRNLDGWMLSRQENVAIFTRQAGDVDVAVVEGVMGLFDGYDGRSEAGSTAQMAKWLDLPVLLVVDARSMARSAGALVHGFATFDPDLKLAGVVFNRVGSERHLEYLRQVMEQLKGISCLGGIPRDQQLGIPERHLGLMTADEHPLNADFQQHLAELMERCLDLDTLLAMMPPRGRETGDGGPGPDKRGLAPNYLDDGEKMGMPDGFPVSRPRSPVLGPRPLIRLGLAQDPAFCFYYPDNLEWLAHFGAQLVPFSPLADHELPRGLDGLYLGGGYPEVFASRLAANHSMLASIRSRAAAGMPIYAECGGLMYLSQGIRDLEGRRFAMVGLLPLEVRMLPRLKSLGYREITLRSDTLLGPAGTRARGHEFHYSEIITEPSVLERVYLLTGRDSTNERTEGFYRPHLLASYVHLHFGSNPEVARHLVEYCAAARRL